MITLTCPLCFGPCDDAIPADVEGPAGHLVSRCPTCRRDWIEPLEPYNTAEIRAAVAEVVERRHIPVLGPSCYGKRHWACSAATCECICHWRAT